MQRHLTELPASGRVALLSGSQGLNMKAAVWIGIAMVVAWGILWLGIKMAVGAVHVLLILGLIAIAWGLFSRSRTTP